jgi:copper chaperone CopZ
MTEVTYFVPNISCGHCVHTIEMEIGELSGVKSVSASQETQQVSIQFEPPTTDEDIITLLKEINYSPG